MTTRTSGFTVLELIVVIVFVLILGTVFYVQKRDLQVGKRDAQRKTAINAIYYNLEDVYYPTHKGYPQTLAADQLPGLDPDQLKDPNGVTVGDQKAQYRYEPKDCKDHLCKSYKLTASMEHEADYIKQSRNQ